jgi:biotin carboxyl carrier protein
MNDLVALEKNLEELIAVINSVVAMSLKTSLDNIRVKSIKCERNKNINWESPFQEGSCVEKFKVTISGNTYEVEVERLTDDSRNGQSKEPLKAPPKPVKITKPNTMPPGGGVISAPMPGTVLDVRVSKGDNVEAGQIILILEAMKMENEIIAPARGTITSVHVGNGDPVSAGEIMIKIG